MLQCSSSRGHANRCYKNNKNTEPFTIGSSREKPDREENRKKVAGYSVIDPIHVRVCFFLFAAGRRKQDFKGFYDRNKLFWKSIEDTILTAACAPPGGGRNEVSPRFFRHFTMMSIPSPSESAMKTIFKSILGGHLKSFPPQFASLLNGLVSSTVDVFFRVCEQLLPTPAKSHYTFNLRDV